MPSVCELWCLMRILRNIKPRLINIIKYNTKTYTFKTKSELQYAVNLWCDNIETKMKPFGHISYWDVSQITQMECLFQHKHNFNDDISLWDVSNVTHVNGMFYCAYKFNQPIGDWNVSNVIRMDCIFMYAKEFNQPIGDWDVSSVTNVENMFYHTIAFNQPICNWDVSSVIDIDTMFVGVPDFELKYKPRNK